MKKFFRKSLAVILSVILCLFATICNLSIFADPAPESVNVVSGLAPVHFTAAGSFDNIKNYNDRTFRYFPTSGAWYNGYTPTDNEMAETWSSYLANLTDSDDSTGVGIRQQYDGDYLALAYAFDSTDITGFSINSSGTHAKDITVYVSSDYSSLFDAASVVYTGTTSDSFVNASAINATGSYIAFVTKDREFTINEIEVYGVKGETPPEPGKNDLLAEGQTPVMFVAAGTAEKIQEGNYDRQLRYFPTSGAWYDGYTPNSTDTKEDWASYLANMTDNNLETTTGIRQRYDGDYLALAYEFDYAAVTGFSIISTAEVHAKPITVYVSKTFDDLLSDDSLVYSGTTAADFTVELDADVKGKYIAFVTNDRDFSIKEISIYGAKDTSSVELEDNDLLAEGQTPALFVAAGTAEKIQEGNYDRQLRYFPTSGAWYDGYTPNSTDTKEDWASYLANMTDNNLETTTGIRQRYDGDYLALAYEFDYAAVTGFSIISTAEVHAKPITVYVSKTFDALLSDDSLVYSGTTAADFTVELDTDVKGKYIAFVTNDRDFSVKEIEVYGEKIEQQNYTPGDINSDGSVNNKDLTRLFQHLSNWDVEVNEDVLDVNGDGSVNNKDLTRLFQYLSNWDVEIF